MVNNKNKVFKDIILLGKSTTQEKEQAVALPITSLTTNLPTYNSSIGFYERVYSTTGYPGASYTINFTVGEITDFVIGLQLYRTGSSSNSGYIVASKLDRTYSTSTYDSDNELTRISTSSSTTSVYVVTYKSVLPGNHYITIYFGGSMWSSGSISFRVKIFSPYGTNNEIVQTFDVNENILSATQQNKLTYNKEEIANQKDVDITLNSATITRYEEESANV
jgi:hypothetical protein